jgi:UDP-N-acetylmuramoyl-L-alanyl-D-glutamate--2,6-diaminopimelate ligase
MRLKSMTINKNGQRLILEINNVDHGVQFPLMGRTQVYNLMCALTIVITMGSKLDAVLKAVERIVPVPGRLNFAGQHSNGAMIYVDYAHKPQALELVLKDMRYYCKGKLHVVFGCGGDRDKDKRAIMGRIAHEHADVVIVTDDNPRTEEPHTIRQQILSESPSAIEIGDRKAAIEYAIQSLNPEDILIVAGKGHEKHQIIGSHKIPFDDMQVISDYLTQHRV